MPRRGDTARQAIMNTITDAFSATNDLVCVQDKKIYVQAKDGVNGETIQFAITMTMPKTPVAAAASESSGISAAPSETPASVINLSDVDREKIEALKRKLGIE